MPSGWNVGVAGFDDPRVWGILPGWRECPGVRLRAAADAQIDRLTRARDENGLLRLYPSWQEMLAREDLHFLQIALPPSERAELVEEAALRGIHCLIQSPMAESLDQAERMLSAARASRVQLLVDWPGLHQQALMRAVQILSSGVFGPLVNAAADIAAPSFEPPPLLPDPQGPDDAEIAGAWNGAAVRRLFTSALPALYFFRLAVGVPVRCSSDTGMADPESPAALVDRLHLTLGYRGGEAVIRTRFSQSGPACHRCYLTAACVDGSLTLDGDQLAVDAQGWAGVPAAQSVEAESVEAESVEAQSLEVRSVEAQTLDEGDASGPVQLYHAVLRGEEVSGPGNAQAGRDVIEMLEAAGIAAMLGRPVSLPLR